jgi:hypothetical protein
MVMGYVKTFETCRVARSESIDKKFRVKKSVSQDANETAASYGCPSAMSVQV